MQIRGIPFDAPLYMSDSAGDFTYQGCEAVMVSNLIAGAIDDLVPAGLSPASSPALGLVIVSNYPFSTVGQYQEEGSFIQVVDQNGQPGFYVPYMYVTTDAAMAFGREVFGTPKKLARIGLVHELDVIQATLERPTGKRLLTVTLKPAARMPVDVFRALVPKPAPLYSVRHLPPIGGHGGVTQLVRWWADIDPHTDASGKAMLFAGPASLTYDSPSVIDPVHRLAGGQVISAIYLRFDLRLGAAELVREY